jgi:hypothetical protein
MYKSFYTISEKYLYRKHICGVGFYSRYHARHIVWLTLGEKALLHIHIIRGDKLIKEGITEIPKENSDRIFVKDPHTRDGSRKVKRWHYPPEFRYDKHRRRHFILYLVRAAEERGPLAFDRKYKKYFNGYRISIPYLTYRRKRNKIFMAFLRELRKAYGLPEEGIQYDQELLRAYRKQARSFNGSENKGPKEELLAKSSKTHKTRNTI